MLSYLGLSKSADEAAGVVPAEEERGQRALPASWFRSPDMYQLERRAIFSRKWMMVAHTLRWTKDGDYVAFEMANMSFFIVRDRDGRLAGFHNICRHRAYPVVEKDSGNAGMAGVFTCRYHGWSYGLRGQLTKAPKYDSVDGFDKAANGLMPVHVRVDGLGFVWVNLQAGHESALDDELEGVDVQKRLHQYNFSDYRYDHSWGLTGDFNWKTAIDNYNECYHCLTGHPDLAAVSNLSKYYVVNKKSQTQHFNTNKDDAPDEAAIMSTYFFPTAAMTVTPHFFYQMRMIPVSPTKTKMEYDVFRHKDATDDEFSWICAFYRRILTEDKELCDGAQRNLNAGVFVNGELHPERELGPLWHQGLIRDMVMEHRKKEDAAGGEIWPAVPRLPGIETEKLREEESFCRSLGSRGCESEVLAW